MARSHTRRAGTDLGGAVADLGVMLPLSAALIVTNGLDGTAVFLCAGLLTIGSGLYFGIPFPVQPLKAMTAVAVAQGLSPGVIHAAGLEIAVVLLVLSVGGVADNLAKAFTRPVVRSLQVGVGILLVVTAYRLVAHPPDVFAGTPSAPWPVLLGVVALAVLWWASRTQRYALALVLLVFGAAYTWWLAAPVVGPPQLHLPRVRLPATTDLATAFVVLVVPQLPLTFGNAIVGVTDVARQNLGDAASRVTPARVCISCGAGNVVSAVLGGVPMCHGAGGLTAHLRLGARTRWMNVGLGSAFVALGVLYGDRVPALLGILPVWVLAAFLVYAGARHAVLVADLRGPDLAVALGAGVAGAWAGNLAVALAIALAYAGARTVHGRITYHHRPPVIPAGRVSADGTEPT